MVKFGRKFFFDRAHTKKNHTTLIIIGIVLVVVTLSIFLITHYFNKKDEVKLVLNKEVKIEVFSEIPSIEKFVKEIKNIKYTELEVVYPNEFTTVEDINSCEDIQDINNCKKTLASVIGEYKITIKTKNEKLNKKEQQVIVKVIDTTKPTLELKEVTITEGNKYEINDFIATCNDNSQLECKYEYANIKDEKGVKIDYSSFTTPGEYEIQIIAIDTKDNKTSAKTKLTINKKKTQNNKQEENKKPNKQEENKEEETSNQKTCEYGDLNYSDAYVIATKVLDKECAISPAEAEKISNKAAAAHNKKLIKEVQENYLQKEIDPMNLEGEIAYEVSYGFVYNTSIKGVVGYFLMAEAKQTVNKTTTTIARYYIDESGNRIWKINTLNLK